MLIQIWTRIYTESVALNIPGQKKIEEIISLIIQSYLEETIKVAGMNKQDFINEDDDLDDENENF